MPTLAFAHPERALPGPVPGSRGGRTARDARRPSGHDVNRSYALGQYGGFVEKFVGDAVMAVFRTPVAHEDDPERALRAAHPTGELPEPLPIGAAGAALDKLQRYTPPEVDLRDAERQFPQLKGQFLVDRDGIVRWVSVEGADEGLAGIGKFPTTEQLLETARALPTRRYAVRVLHLPLGTIPPPLLAEPAIPVPLAHRAAVAGPRLQEPVFSGRPWSLLVD